MLVLRTVRIIYLSKVFTKHSSYYHKHNTKQIYEPDKCYLRRRRKI